MYLLGLDILTVLSSYLEQFSNWCEKILKAFEGLN
jgi:hypothetical protein